MNAVALRHNLDLLRNSGHATDDAIAEIERAINEYETNVDGERVPPASAGGNGTAHVDTDSSGNGNDNGNGKAVADADALHHVLNAPNLSPAAHAVLRMIDTSIQGTSISNTPGESAPAPADRQRETAAATHAESSNLETLTSGMVADANRKPAIHGGTSDLFFSLALPADACSLSPALTQRLHGHPHGEEEADEFLHFEANRFKRRYKLLESVGEGAFGQVYRARDIYLHRDVALKRLNVRNFDERHKNALYLYRYSLVLEARIGAQLVHPNLVPIHDFGVDDKGNPYVVMRFLQGGQTLREMLRQRERGKLDVTRDELLRVLLRAIDGLAYAHDRGVVNRDVKPENIYVADHGDVTVLDWGVARLLDDTSVDLAEMSAAVKDEVAAAVLDNPKDASARSLLGGTVGTVPYMSPEQVEGRLHDIDRRTDVWAVGVILYEILTGHWPFEGDAALQVQMNIRSGTYSSAKTRVDSILNEQTPSKQPWVPDRVPHALDTIVRKALAHSQADRYPTLCAMAHDIGSFLNDRPLENASPIEVISKWAKRNRKLVAAVSTTSVLFLLVLAIGLFAYVTAVTTERALAEDARGEAELQRNNAEAQRKEAEHQRDAAESARADALMQERTAKQRLVSGLVASADAMGLQERWTEAREAYDEAFSLLTELGEDTFPALVGQWDTDRNAPSPIHTLTGLEGTVLATTFSADGLRALVADSSGALTEWDLITGLRVRTIAAQEPRLRASAIKLSADEKLLVVANADGAVRAYEMATGVLQWERAISKHPVTSLALAPAGVFVLAATADDRVVRLDGATGERRATLDAKGTVRDVAIAPDGKTAAVAVFGRGVLLLDVAAGQGGNPATLAVAHIWTEIKQPERVVFSPHGPRLAAVGDWTLAVYDMENPQHEPLTQRSRRDMLLGVTFTPCDNLIVFNLNSFDVWLLDRKVILWSVNVQRHIPATLSFSPDGTMALLGLPNRAVGYWNIYMPGASRVLRGHAADLRTAAFTHDNRMVFTGDLAGEVWAWDVATARPVALYTFDRAVVDLAVSEDNRTLLVGLSDGAAVNPRLGRVVAVDLDTREYDVLWDDPDLPVARGALSRDARHSLITIAEDDAQTYAAAMLDTATGQIINQFRGLPAKPLTAAYSPDGKWVAIATTDGSIRMYNRATGALQTVADRPTRLGQTHQIVFSHDSRYVLCGNLDFTVYAIDPVTGATAHVMRGHTGPVVSITVIQNMAMSVGLDNLALLWNLEVGELIHTFATPHAAFLGAIASDDSRYGVMGGVGGALELWDTMHCKLQLELEETKLAAQATLQENPDSADAQLAIARWLDFKNTCGMSLTAYQRAEALGAPPPPALTRARCHWRAGDNANARKYFEQARANDEAPDWYIDYMLGAIPMD